MKKGELTKERIIEQTAPLFNQRGFFGSSLSDIMESTGLKKGGIYNHFESKEDLALQAFDYAMQCTIQRASAALDVPGTSLERLIAYADYYRDISTNPPVPGGCPLLNTAIESDDAHPALRKRAQSAMDRWRRRIREIVRDGVAIGEIKADTDAEVVATRFIATIEGGLMMSRLYRDPVHLNRAADFVVDYLRGLAA